jgi:hypothetical protein
MRRSERNADLDAWMKRIEKDNRDTRTALLMLAAGTLAAAFVTAISGGLPAAIALALAAATVVVKLEIKRSALAGIVRTRKLEIVGTDGTVRVALGETVEGTGEVATYDASGRVLPRLGVSEGEPA